MRPNTVELLTCLACDEAKKNIDKVMCIDAVTINASDLREYATACAENAAIFEALENLLMTAAEELNAADQNAEGATYHPGLWPYQSTDNVMLMTHEEHAEAHAPLK